VLRKIAIIYNKPGPRRYADMGENKAILAVLEGVAAVRQGLCELGYEVTTTALLPPYERFDCKSTVPRHRCDGDERWNTTTLPALRILSSSH
jgi:hypothetical protein